MTVKELIEKLKEYSSETEVFVWNLDGPMLAEPVLSLNEFDGPDPKPDFLILENWGK